MAIKTCKACGKLFEGTGTAFYCSAKCKAELRKQTIRKTERVCKLCGKIFYIKFEYSAIL